MGYGQNWHLKYLCVALACACSVDKNHNYKAGQGGESGSSGSTSGGRTAGTGGGPTGGSGGRGGSSSAGSTNAGAGGVIANGGTGGSPTGGTTANPEGGTDGGETDTGGTGGSPPEPPKGEPCKAADGTYECLGTAGKTRRVCRDGYWEDGESCAASQNCDSRDGSCKEIIAQCVDQTPGFRYCDASNQSLTCGPDLVSTESLACMGKCVQGQCAPVSCGDGVKQAPEECDDGNMVDTDDCTSGCKNKACGDGFIQSGEACDDGNTTAGDGCTSCKVDSGYGCTGAPSSCTPKCGDGIVVSGKEACDDGNATNSDGCTSCKVDSGYGCTGAPSSCTTKCGDGIVVSGKEACDDGNTTAGDGCVSCQVASGYACTGSPSSCATKCGDGIVAGSEACDDKNTASNDGCNSSCKVETGYTCSGVTCTPKCGDKIVISGKEACDDGNTVNDDGCKNDCTINKFQVFKPPANYTFWVEDTNADGSAIVGQLAPVPQQPFHEIGFHWTQAAGVKTIPGIDCVQNLLISGNGSVVVGNSSCTKRPFRWSPGAAAVTLLWEDWENKFGAVAGISTDGSVIVGGWSPAPSTDGAFRWTGGITKTLLLPGMSTEASSARAVGAEGGVVVGSAALNVNAQAMRWVGTGTGSTIPIPTGFTTSQAGAVSADGSVIFGWASNGPGGGASDYTVFKWTSSGGSVLLKSGAVTGYVNGCSNDGKIVIGSGPNGNWIWDDSTQQLRSIGDILTGLGVKLSDWSDFSGQAISDDGKVLVGHGTPVNGTVRSAWIARFR